VWTGGWSVDVSKRKRQHDSPGKKECEACEWRRVWRQDNTFILREWPQLILPLPVAALLFFIA